MAGTLLVDADAYMCVCRNADDTGDGFIVLEDTTVALANVGIMSW